MVNPQPTIACDGQTLSCDAVPDDNGVMVFPTDRPTLVDSMRIEWGRADQWAQPDPSVLTFQVWEPQARPGSWIAKIVTGQALRRGVQVSYTSGWPYASPDTNRRTIFQGFTTNVDVAQSWQKTAQGRTAGWLVTIQASDRTAFLGQLNWGAITLPAQSMVQRAVRIRNQAASIGVREYYFEASYESGPVKAVDVKDSSVLDSLSKMYESFADQWYYDPHRNVVSRIPTGSNFGGYQLTLGTTRRVVGNDNRVRLYPPGWIDPVGQQSELDKQPHVGGYIGAAQVTAELVLAADAVQDITVISCKWYDAVRAKADHQTDVTVKDSWPVNRLEFESWFTDGQWIDPAMGDVKRMVTGDGSRPLHPQIRWDTAKSGDVPDWGSFDALTLPAQTIRQVVLAGSPFSGATGYAPVWQPCGGVIEYRSGRWVFDVNLAPNNVPLPLDHQPVTFATMPRSVRIGSPDTPRVRTDTTATDYLDESLSSYDLYYARPQLDLRS